MLSDWWGRKKIILTGCLVAAVSYYPLYRSMAGAAIDPATPRVGMLILLVFIQVIFVTMVYGPMAAYLVELFPTRIRYTSMSLPYHIGNGVFGGLTPFIGTALVASTGNLYAGLFYPCTVAVLTFIIGALYLPDNRNVRLASEST